MYFERRARQGIVVMKGRWLVVFEGLDAMLVFVAVETDLTGHRNRM
jgi:hypothetical protein